MMRIIYIDVDSLRPDHMGCYGYIRNTTPHIDRIAKKGMRFDSCYISSSPCVPSRASFISGRFAINHGAMTHWGPGSEYYYPVDDVHSREFPFLSRYLRNAGYRTVTFSNFADRHMSWWFLAGWEETHTPTLKSGAIDADEVNQAVIPWLKQHGTEENYFLHIQYWDPHTFYTYPRSFFEQWNDSPVKEFPSQQDIERHQQDSFFRSAKYLHQNNDYTELMPEKIENRSDLKHLIDGYDGGISYMDYHIGELLKVLNDLGIEDEVCFIISADHGESMGEQGIYMDHMNATESVHRVPLIMTIPGVTPPGQNVDGFVYNVDVRSPI